MSMDVYHFILSNIFCYFNITIQCTVNKLPVPAEMRRQKGNYGFKLNVAEMDASNLTLMHWPLLQCSVMSGTKVQLQS